VSVCLAKGLSNVASGFHKCSVAYTSAGHRRYNQPFSPTPYGTEYVQGDVIGVGYKPRTGTIFFTRNGKKLDDVAHALRTQNLFPAVGANGPCTVHVNFGQSGFVFIEANVKKWGLAPMTGSLAPPPPYGSEQGSVLLEGGPLGATQSRAGQHSGIFTSLVHGRTRSGNLRLMSPTSPGPARSPTDISLARLLNVPSTADSGEGGSSGGTGLVDALSQQRYDALPSLGFAQHGQPPPDYSSPTHSRDGSDDAEDGRLLSERGRGHAHDAPIPSYSDVVGGQRAEASGRRGSRAGSVEASGRRF
jgi:hypothetical protein